MAISVSDIASLIGRDIYSTSSDTHVLTKDFEKIIISPEYTLLGFLNNQIYSSNGEYLVQSTNSGDEIARIRLEIEHASFIDGLSYFYAYMDNILYKIDESFEILWMIEFPDDIQSISMDIKGCLYILFQGSRTIRKYLPDKTELMMISDSDDVTKTVNLYNCFVTKGAGWFYVIGSEFWDYNDKVNSFIDKYNARTGERVERLIFEEDKYISPDDPFYAFDRFYIKGDYIYLFANQYVSKMNIKGIHIWKYLCDQSNMDNEMVHVEYTDNTYDEDIYFAETYPNTNGHSFGRLSINGKLVWKISLEESAENSNFRFCIYKNKIYTSSKEYIKYKRKYILSLNDERVLFRSQNGNLIQIVEYNTDELYSADKYYGRYLLADTIKDGVEKTTLVPLRHDFGHVVDEHGNVLLLPMESNYQDNLDNYDYRYILSKHFMLEKVAISNLVTKGNRRLLTRLANRLKSLHAYMPEQMIEYISTLNDKNVITVKNEDNVIRDRYGYFYNKFLLADKNMFWTYLLTKQDYVIITKKRGYKIVRKTREIYKYALSRYNDVNIITEWLLENGVMDSLLPKYVDEIRHHTANMIKDMQVAGTPTLYDINPIKKFEYSYDGFNYRNNTWGVQIFACTNLPFDKRYDKPDEIYIDSMANLISSKEMRPFLLFLNGKAVKWSNCTIVKDWKYTYVVIKNTNPEETNLECILFPCNIRYGEDTKALSNNNTFMYFDKDGLLTQDKSKISIRVEIIDANVKGITNTYKDKYIEVENNYNQIASEKNIFAFENNKLFSESRFYIEDYGKDIFTYNRNVSNVIFKGFYYIKANSYYGNLYNIPNGSIVKNDIISSARNKSDNSNYNNFNTTFDFKLYRTKDYNTNIAEAVEYILKYNLSLLIKYYKDQSNLKSYIYTGKELLSRRSSTTGCISVPRSRINGLQDYVLIFKNNDLYEYLKDITYEANTIQIPLYDIKDTDVIEILHFRNVDNSYSTLSVTSKPDYIDESLRYNNFLLFGNSKSNSDHYIDFNVETCEQYAIDFDYKNNSTNNKYKNTEISLRDSYYIDKKINICSKRQFQSMYYNITNTTSDIALSPDFRFCQLTNHYMIFVNKKRISMSSYFIKLPIDTGNTHIHIAFYHPLSNGDVVEIFYLPDAYEEISVDNSDSKGYGDICMNMDDLGYPFDKDLFMIFVNGNKINYNSIDNINNHRVRIVNDITSNSSNIIKNVTVAKFIKPDELLGKLFSYSDQWSNAVDALSPVDYNKLLTSHVKI